MNSKTLRRQRELKNKLMAAISMLLVSSLMLVTSTYAWFTLSTAPEVTGITTAVGANGNLEMALLPAIGNTVDRENNYGVASGTSDSMASQAANLANVTWGNLVDLKTFYGLENVTLYPSQVNATTTEGVTNIITDGSILKTPTYGADGRVSSLTANTIAGVYNTEQGKAYEEVVVGSDVIKNPAGVRLIGTVSGMSDRQLDFRNAVSYASAAGNSAQGSARGALEDNGDALGNIAVKYATNSTDPYTADDRDALIAMVEALQGTTGKKGALDYVEDGLRQYIYAYQISVSTTEDGYLALKTQILGDETATALTLADLQTEGLAPSSMNNMIAALAKSRADVAKADEELDKMGDSGSYTWTQISGAMSSLVNIQKLSINGTPVYNEETSAITDGLKTKITDDFLAGKGITLTMPSGSGVFADISDFTGDYGANIGVPASAVIKDSTQTIKASMVTDGRTPTYFSDAKDIVNEKPISADGNAAQAISDYYGYVIDLAFRTNAADSNLQLQTQAVNRIYTEDTTTEETMGGGATMIFTSSDPENGFQETEMMELMKHIRVVFFDPSNNNKVLAYGVLDEDSMKPMGNYEVSVGLKVATTPTPTASDYIENNVIMPLEQNKAHRLSVLVYLDGTTLTNAGVAVGSATSMTGRLNLQFSSSADLEPMQYTDFEKLDGTSNSGGNESAKPTVTPVTVGSVTENYSATLVHVAIGEEYKLVATIKSGETIIDDSVNMTVTIGEETAEYNTFGTYSGWVVEGTETVPAGAVNITVATN